MVVLVVGSAMPPLDAADLRGAVVSRAIQLLDAPGRRAFWRALEVKTGEISTSALLDFAAYVEGARAKSPAALQDLEPKGVHLVGLLPYQALFTGGGPAAVGRALRRDSQSDPAPAQPLGAGAGDAVEHR